MGGLKWGAGKREKRPKGGGSSEIPGNRPFSPGGDFRDFLHQPCEMYYFFNRQKKVHLTFEQHRFELRGSTYTAVFSIVSFPSDFLNILFSLAHFIVRYRV